MALGGIVPDFNPFQNALAAAQASNAYANSYDKRANTREFLKTQEERVKATDAKHKLETQTADMSREEGAAIRETGEHVTAAKAESKQRTQTAKTTTAKQKQTGDFIELSKITDQNSWEQAAIYLQKEGWSQDQIEDLIGPLDGDYASNKNLIEVQRQRMAESQEALATQANTRLVNQGNMERTRAQVAGQITVAQMNREATLQAARIRALQTRESGALIGQSLETVTPQQMLDLIISTQDKTWTGKTNKKLYEEAEFIAKSERMAMLVNKRMKQLALQWDTAIARGMPTDDLVTPYEAQESIALMAMREVMQQTSPIPSLITSTPEESAIRDEMSLVINDPTHPKTKEYEALLDSGIPPQEAMDLISKSKERQRADLEALKQ